MPLATDRRGDERSPSAPETAATDPLYDATDATTGGGDTGSVLISPYIKPGTVSTVYYNHYSWLRTMEDLFNVAASSPGLDGQGHIGYAAQAGAVRHRRVQQRQEADHLQEGRQAQQGQVRQGQDEEEQEGLVPHTATGPEVLRAR